jgi:hypothetical protein
MSSQVQTLAKVEPLVESNFNTLWTGQGFPKLGKLPNKHKLELNYPNILTYEQLPPNGDPNGEWVYIGTIVESLSIWRPMYRVRDSDGVIILIAFHIDRGTPIEHALGQLPPGSMISVRGAIQYMFMDGQEGFRIENEDLNDVKVSKSVER